MHQRRRMESRFPHHHWYHCHVLKIKSLQTLHLLPAFVESVCHVCKLLALPVIDRSKVAMATSTIPLCVLPCLGGRANVGITLGSEPQSLITTHTVILNSQHTQSFRTVNTHSHSEQSTHTVNLNSQTFTPSSLTQNAWGLFLAREVFGGIIPRLCFLSGQQLALTNATLEAGNSQRRLIELRRLWTHVP